MDANSWENPLTIRMNSARPKSQIVCLILLIYLGLSAQKQKYGTLRWPKASIDVRHYTTVRPFVLR